MMCLFSKNRTCILLVLLLVVSACTYKKKDPIYKSNTRFLSKYSDKIKKSKEKHKKLAAQNGIFYDAELESIYGVAEQNKIREQKNKEFLKEYVNFFETEEKMKVLYADQNYGPYSKNKEYDDAIKEFNKFYLVDKDSLKQKNYNCIDYKTAQISFDYVGIIREYQKQDEIEQNKLSNLEVQEKEENNSKAKSAGVLQKFKSFFKKSN